MSGKLYLTYLCCVPTKSLLAQQHYVTGTTLHQHNDVLDSYVHEMCKKEFSGVPFP